MSLKHCIIHHIERPVPGAEVVTRLRDGENPTTDATFSLFEQLKQSFQRSSLKQYGCFDREQGDNPLPGWLRDQLAEKSSFAAISTRIMEQLQQKMQAHDEAFSAHIMLALETVMDQPQFYIFWITHTDANYIDSDLEVSSARFIDSGKLYYAARLFIEEWLEQETRKYLAIITARGNKNLSDSFADFIGFSAGLDPVEDTGEFLDIVDRYVDSLPEEKTSDIKGKILDYCIEQDKYGAPIVFDDISSQLDDASPEQFASFVTEQQQQPRNEIYTDRGSLKRYVRFFGRDNTMSISFSSDLFGDEVIYDEAKGTLTLMKIPKSLKQQLSRQKKHPEGE